MCLRIGIWALASIVMSCERELVAAGGCLHFDRSCRDTPNLGLRLLISLAELFDYFAAGVTLSWKPSTYLTLQFALTVIIDTHALPLTPPLYLLCRTPYTMSFQNDITFSAD